MKQKSIKYRLKGLCADCGEFEVIRPRRKLRSTSGNRIYYHPQSLVCPSCHKWADVVEAREVA